MGLFDRFRKPQSGALEQTPDLADEFRGQPIHYDIRKLAPSEMWETQPHLRTVVSFLARNIAQLGVHSFERQGETDRVRDRESTAARLLRRPNSETTSYELLFSLVGDLALYDVAFWWVAQDSEAPAGWSIVRLPPEWVKPKNADAFRRASYDVKAPGGKTVNFPAAEVLTFHGYNPTDSRDGSTPISALKGVLQEQLQSSLYRQQVWKNGGRVSAVLNRPAGATWTPEARDRFREDWYSLYTGSGPKAGGTPILEDGMTLQKIDFNAQEQQYVEGAKLSFATVCSAYHVNPTMVGLLDNANYSNVREFRRMLYGDTLGPIITQIEDRLNTFLLPMVGMDDATHYLEFNVEAKLRGNFEEQSAAMQSATGAPWMTRNEARALRNMPAVEGGDDLVVPLNVLTGGQASPRDSASQNEEPKSMTVHVKGKASRSTKARPNENYEKKHAEVLAKFFRRQGAAVGSLLGADAETWWDSERWDKELAADLLSLALLTSTDTAKAVAAELDLDPDAYDVDRTQAFLSAVAERQAGAINAVTEQQVADALEEDDPDVAHVFEVAEESRAQKLATSLVTAAAGFGTREVAHQLLDATKATKTWVTGSNPRPTHARMDGETVPVGEKFSNGADWPGSSGDVDEDAGCNCSLRVNP